jgi:NADPH2:quinone reductase
MAGAEDDAHRALRRHALFSKSAPSISVREEVSMHAVTVNEYGGAPVLTELPNPQPGPEQILIKVRAAGMNPMDRLIADGAWKARMNATFPLVPGSDFEGVVTAVGDGEAKFAPGDELFGQLLIEPLGSAGTYAEYVAVPDDASVARVPSGLDPVVAATLPTAGVTALEMVESLQPLGLKTVLISGATGGVGSFATQLAANAGAHVIATAQASAADRMRGYGAAETIDYTAASVPDAVRREHPEGIDALIDVANDADGFAALATLVRPGGTAVTTRHIADAKALAAAGVTGVNFQNRVTPDVLERLANAVVSGRIVAPPITRIELDDVPAAMHGEGADRDGKIVITL